MIENQKEKFVTFSSHNWLLSYVYHSNRFYFLDIILTVYENHPKSLILKYFNSKIHLNLHVKIQMRFFVIFKQFEIM